MLPDAIHVPVAPMLVTADNPLPAWNTQKTSQAYCPGLKGRPKPLLGCSTLWFQRRRGRSVVVPPDHIVAGVGQSVFSFDGPPGGGFKSSSDAVPPSSPRHGGRFGSGFRRECLVGRDSTWPMKRTSWARQHPGALLKVACMPMALTCR